MLRTIMPAARTRRTTLALATLALAGGLAACGDSATATGDVGRFSLLLTDAPGDFEKAVVTIDRIELMAGEGDDLEGGRVVLLDTPVTTDLLTLANSTAELVKDAVVPGGSYSQLRFVISGGYIEVEQADGSTRIYASSPSYAGLPAGAEVDGSLQMPSFAQSGLKINLPEGSRTIDGDQKVVMVDFDVSRSFGQQAGNSGQWVMRPTLTAVNLSTTGTLRVSLAKDASVTLPTIDDVPVTLGDFRAVLKTAEGSSEPLVLTDANADGVFEGDFRFVVPGAYTLEFTAPETVTFTTNPASPVAVTLGSASVVSQAVTITAASTTTATTP